MKKLLNQPEFSGHMTIRTARSYDIVYRGSYILSVCVCVARYSIK